MPQKSTIPAPTFALIVLAVMVGLYGVDKFLASQEQAELQQEARNHYTEGQKFLSAGKPHDAVAAFARAHAVERSNSEYELALATAQLSDHQLSAARDTLNEVLEENSNDGRANLLMARVLAAEARYKDADSFYHRAIYGQWPADQLAEPRKVRLELANMLAEHGRSQELLSELLLLQSAASADLQTGKQIAGLFLQAGSAQRAADAYRHLINENPADVDAYLGLGQAEILSGNYRAAESAVMSALRRRPYDERIQSQLRLVVRLASLDPTSRRLSSAEKYRRSEAILALVRDRLSACLQNTQPENPEVMKGAVTNEIAEARLDRAESLWKERGEACKQPPALDDPLPILMKKLSQ
jgi:tetratricopeptide (TPR) repeat protein